MDTSLEDLEEKKRLVTEKLGVFFQEEKNMAPVAGRILSTLIINGNKGITFEQLVKDVQASKSTVITYLNDLISEGRISYYTKEGDRKRYFVLAPDFLAHKIQNQSTAWAKEIAVRKEVLAFKEAHNKVITDDPYSLKCEKDILNFLKESVEFFDQLIEKIKS